MMTALGDLLSSEFTGPYNVDAATAGFMEPFERQTQIPGIVSCLRGVLGSDTDRTGDTTGTDARPDGGTVNDWIRRGPVGRAGRKLDDRFGDDFAESLPFWPPPFLLMGLFIYGAIVWNPLISLTDYQGFARAPNYRNLDFEMYVQAVTDPGVIDATINIFILIVVFLAATLVIGLGLASAR